MYLLLETTTTTATLNFHLHQSPPTTYTFPPLLCFHPLPTLLKSLTVLLRLVTGYVLLFVLNNIVQHHHRSNNNSKDNNTPVPETANVISILSPTPIIGRRRKRCQRLINTSGNPTYISTSLTSFLLCVTPISSPHHW